MAKGIHQFVGESRNYVFENVQEVYMPKGNRLFILAKNTNGVDVMNSITFVAPTSSGLPEIHHTALKADKAARVTLIACYTSLRPDEIVLYDANLSLTTVKGVNSTPPSEELMKSVEVVHIP